MAKLKKELQIYIVQQLALFEKPTVIRERLKEDFGIEVSLPAVIYYDIANPGLPQAWKDLFTETRESFLKNVGDIPIANKAFRLRELDRLYHRRKGAKNENPIEQRATLEQAAKEAGDAFTNRKEITGKDGESLTQPIADALSQFDKSLEKIYGGSDGGSDSSETKES